MSFINGIFERSTVKGITNYLLFGETIKGEDLDYMMRITKAYKDCEKILLQYDKNVNSALYNAVDNLVSETEEVYMEIGVQSGFLIMKDMISKLDFYKDTENKELIEVTYQKMYDSLFCDISLALKILQEKEEGSVDRVIAVLQEAQCKTEEIFMHSEI